LITSLALTPAFCLDNVANAQLVQDNKCSRGSSAIHECTSFRKVMTLLKRQQNWAMLMFTAILKHCMVGYFPQVTGSEGRSLRPGPSKPENNIRAYSDAVALTRVSAREIIEHSVDKRCREDQPDHLKSCCFTMNMINVSTREASSEIRLTEDKMGHVWPSQI
jgi:hypothetical protein